MSKPSFPENTNLTRDEVINQILSSIAMEELGLSHVINAEGEKLQYALGTLTGATGPTEPLTIDDLMQLNASIHKTLASGITCGFGSRGEVVALGFGSCYRFSHPADPIVLPTTSGFGQSQLAFSLPRGGVITAMTAYISVAAADLYPNTITAQLYSSRDVSNTFAPLEGAKIVMTIPPTTIGTIRHGIVQGLTINVSAEERLLMIFYNVASGSSTPTLFMSGGIMIDTLPEQQP